MNKLYPVTLSNTMSSGDDGSRINILISSARRVFIMKAVAVDAVRDVISGHLGAAGSLNGTGGHWVWAKAVGASVLVQEVP